MKPTSTGSRDSSSLEGDRDGCGSIAADFDAENRILAEIVEDDGSEAVW